MKIENEKKEITKIIDIYGNEHHVDARDIRQDLSEEELKAEILMDITSIEREVSEVRTLRDNAWNKLKDKNYDLVKAKYDNAMANKIIPITCFYENKKVFELENCIFAFEDPKAISRDGVYNQKNFDHYALFLISENTFKKIQAYSSLNMFFTFISNKNRAFLYDHDKELFSIFDISFSISEVVTYLFTICSSIIFFSLISVI